MKTKTLPLRSLSALAAASIVAAAMSAGRAAATTRDVAYQFRCPAGYPGDVNRAHPNSIEPALIDAAAPPLLYGNAVVIGANNGVRQMAAGDTGLTKIYGIVARDYPTQQMSGGPSAPAGAMAPPVTGALSIVRYGYVMVRVNGTPTKGAAAFLWVAASSGNHVQGTWEAAATGGSTIQIANAEFNGPPDSAGNVELIVWESV